MNDPETSSVQRGLTARALLLGMVLSAAIGVVGYYLEVLVQGGNPTLYFTSQIAHVILFLLIGTVNALLKVAYRPLALNQGELLVIFIMMCLANSTHVLVYYWIALVPSPIYFATAENGWETSIVPQIPDWLIPHDPAAIRDFYEGAQGGSSNIHWQVWLEPILGWAPAIVAVNVAFICVMVILRRRWMDHERLIYPVVQLPLAMVQEGRNGAIIGPFFRGGAMWLGFLVPVVVGTFIGLHRYYPFVPTIDLILPLPLFNARLSFATIGFFYLIQREVAFGLWAFTLLNNLQAYIYAEVGWGIEESPAVSVWSYGLSSLVHQGMGAMVILLLGGLWLARDHLYVVWRKAFNRAPEYDDGDEILSYRAAFWGFWGSVAVFVAWLVEIGIPLHGALVFTFFSFVVWIGLSRVIAEGGVAVIYAPLVAADATVSYLGSRLLGPSGMVGTAFARVLGNDQLNFVMPHVANGLKLGEQVVAGSRPVRRRLFWAMLAATLLGTGGAIWEALNLAYIHGAVNLWPVIFVKLPGWILGFATPLISDPIGADLRGWFHTGIGAAVMGLLMLARRIWVWWPLHPVGFPISATFSWMAFNAFLAWAVKGPVLRYGGARLYAATRPFFLGMIMGQFVIFGIFWIVDTLTGMVGNRLFL